MSEVSARSGECPASDSAMAMVELAHDVAVEPPRDVAVQPARDVAVDLVPEVATFEVARPSFEELYTSSYQSLVRLAFVLTGSLEVSEDLVQDCFVRLHHHYEALDTPDRYVRQAVVNACRSHFRRLGRERDRRPLLYVIDGDGVAGAGASSGELHDILLRLPYRQRVAIVLRYYADQSEMEIAAVLGCRPGTVGSLIHRGLERMREVLQP